MGRIRHQRGGGWAAVSPQRAGDLPPRRLCTPSPVLAGWGTRQAHTGLVLGDVPGQATLTFQQVHLQPLNEELGRVEAVGGCDAFPGRLAADVVQDAALPRPVQPQHQHLPPVQLWGTGGGGGGWERVLRPSAPRSGSRLRDQPRARSPASPSSPWHPHLQPSGLQGGFRVGTPSPAGWAAGWVQGPSSCGISWRIQSDRVQGILALCPLPQPHELGGIPLAIQSLPQLVIPGAIPIRCLFPSWIILGA